MFDTVSLAPPDPILGLSDAFASDSRANKINLTIGVYQDDQGRTPVLQCVKQAEKVLLDTEQTKGYLGIDGLNAFRNQAVKLALDGIVPGDRVTSVQTPGGTGALKVAADLLRKNFGPIRVWVSHPTWPNHVGLFESAGLVVESYPYLTADKKSLDFSAMLDTLRSQGRPGDVICLHGCCHNPSGIDPDAGQWKLISELAAETKMLPLIDFAYHGFGDGLEEDRIGLKAIGAQHSEFLVCSSFSKNFGLYSERVGALLAVCASPAHVVNVGSSAKQVVRTNYSNPPRHGGALIATILEDEALKQLWMTELTAMRSRIHDMRQQLVAAMAVRQSEIDFSFLLKQRGMFSFSGLSQMQVDWLRRERGVYIVGSGRINVAGITSANLPALADAIAAALQG
ncbi:MAG: aspartate/tyrosine/aromatic aminotransferase [Pirellulaceae bacterium]|nr:aspartate/tyrosine/aromatic aminotransferase [Pirellulaceae bacterium]